MMKSKFMAGLVASLICLVVVVAAAIMITEMTHGNTGDRLIKIVAFGVIGIWVALYAWLKPKEKPAENNSSAPPAKEEHINTKNMI